MLCVQYCLGFRKYEKKKKLPLCADLSFVTANKYLFIKFKLQLSYTNPTDKLLEVCPEKANY